MLGGFVYVWRDRKHRRFYVGSHWGSEIDGYICGSSWMRAAYRRRPQDFKRRIVSRIDSDRPALYREEARWLDMVKDGELGNRYYNLRRWTQGHWSVNGNPNAVREKIKEARKRQKIVHSEETREKLKKANANRVLSEEAREKMRAAAVAYNARRGPTSPETGAKISAANRGRKFGPPSEDTRKKIGAANRNPSESTREKMRAAKLGKKLSPEHREKLVAKLIGRQVSAETRAKMSESAKNRRRPNSQTP